jgi:import inner membrane translocase subunit TIM10
MFSAYGNRVSPELLQAESNLDLMVETQSTAVETCRKRCINPAYKEGTLSKAETTCTDRCIQKFFETNKYIEKLAIQVLLENQQQKQ